MRTLGSRATLSTSSEAAVLRSLVLVLTIAFGGALAAMGLAGCQAHEICDDNADNDGDGLKDCHDPDCAGNVHCAVGEGEGEGEGEGAEGEGEGEGGEGEGEGGSGLETNCTDNVDNDHNGFTDCEDDNCFFFDPACQPHEIDCSDLQDDDFDGLFDCFDEPDCKDAGLCTPGPGALNTPCAKQSDCSATNSDPFCFREFQAALGSGTGYSAGACSEFCDANDPCPQPGVCVPVFGGAALCMQACSDDSECRDATQICDAFAFAPSGQKVCVAAPVCGNLQLEIREECDDGNTVDGDGCSADCRLEACLAPSFGVLQLGTTAGDTSLSGSNDFEGRCLLQNGIGASEVVQTFTPPGPGKLFLSVNGSAGFGVYARAICNDITSELSCDASSKNPKIAVNVVDTDVFVVVDAVFGVGGPFVLDAAFHDAVCGDGVVAGAELCDGQDIGDAHCRDVVEGTIGTPGCSSDCASIDATNCVTPDLAIHEVEPNDFFPDEVNPYADPFVGNLNADNFDVDCVSIAVTAGQTVNASMEDLGDGACLGGALFANVEIFDVDHTTSLIVGGPGSSGEGFCASAEAAFTESGDAVVCVSGDGTHATQYTLTLSVLLPGCGGGFVDGAEQCDDGNNNDGDGCSADCRAEECTIPKVASIGDNFGAIGNVDFVEAVCGFSQSRSGEDVWEFDPAVDGTVTVSMTGGLDFVIEARSTCNDGGATLTCANNSTISFAAVGGVPVFLVVETFFGGEPGAYTMNVQE